MHTFARVSTFALLCTCAKRVIVKTVLFAHGVCVHLYGDAVLACSAFRVLHVGMFCVCSSPAYSSPACVHVRMRLCTFSVANMCILHPALNLPRGMCVLTQWLKGYLSFVVHKHAFPRRGGFIRAY